MRKAVLCTMALSLIAFALSGCDQIKEAGQAMDEAQKAAKEAAEQGKKAADEAQKMAKEAATQGKKAMKEAQAAATKAVAGAKGGVGAAAGAEEDGTVAKINAYVGCVNGLSERAHMSKQRYLEWCDPEKGPTGEEGRITYGVYAIHSPESCEKEVTKVIGLKPALPELEAAGDAYLAAVKALHPLLVEADKYYDQGDYKDDGAAKGRVMHPNLMSAWAEFEIADVGLNAGLKKVLAEQNKKQMEAIEKAEGRSLNYLVMSSMMQAEVLLELGMAGGLDKIDAEKFKAEIEEYGTLVDELEKKSKEDEEGVRAMFGFSSYLGSSRAVQTAAKDLMRRVRDKEPFSPSEIKMLGTPSGWMVKGSPDKLANEYNSLVGARNSLH